MDFLPILIALGGGGGIGAGITALVTSIQAVRSGVSAKSEGRRKQIEEQRDEALQEAADARRRAAVAEAREELANRNQQRAREHAADLRNRLMEEFGVKRGDLPDWPSMEDTIPAGRLAEILATMKGTP